MGLRRSAALHEQVAAKLRRSLLAGAAAGTRLPPDAALAARWGVSVRTIREALLVLAAAGEVSRRQGSGTFVLARAARPVALYSELNVLRPESPRFFGLTLDLVRRELAAQGLESRLYTGRSQAGEEPGPFTCPELLADAAAGRLAAVVGITSKLDDPRLQAAGLPLITVTEGSPLAERFAVTRIPPLAVQRLAHLGRRRLALIGWDAPGGNPSRLVASFREALHAAGLPFHPEWCRVDLNYAWRGAGWEELREIWFARDERPDGLVVVDENYLPEIVMAVLQLGLRVPRDLHLVSHKARFVEWQLPVPVTWIEQNVAAFAGHLARQAAAAVRGEPPPALPDEIEPYLLQALPAHPVAEPMPLTKES
jgi:DNA-binding LacI/PurR family transcriptional regulator